MPLRRLPVAAFVCALAGLAAPVAFGQTSGGVRGTVIDDNGHPLPGAVVTLKNEHQASPGRGAVTGSAGEFQIASLPPAGDYALSVRLAGFATVTLHDIEVPPGRFVSLQVVLQPESRLRERVEVRAKPHVVDLDDTTIESRFSSEFIEALPILGRDYQDILSLAPGVSDVDGDGNPNIHGARDTDVVTLVDGVSTTDPLTGKIGAQLNIESIQEIEIKTSGATAEFGRAQGGFVNIITKSGGNEFKGTFKFFWRGSLLDGDGAGSDSPRLHAGVGEVGIRDLHFNDYLPFLSFEGPIVRDRAWFFMAHEYVHLDEPVNALNTAFVAGTREFREFAKLTWQVAANQRLSLSLNYDPQEYLNRGLNSFSRVESGFTDKVGGPILTLKAVSILNPYVSLETSVSHFDERPARTPTLDPDTNHNGIMAIDFDRDGELQARERDPGEDFDLDGAFDVLEFTDDLDGDGRIVRHGCEGAMREDKDCDGRLDVVPEDVNRNGILDSGEDRDYDGNLDAGDEDRNRDGNLNDTPFPATLYPYGRLAPVAPDRDYSLNQKTGIVSGPFYQDLFDRRRRFTFRQDLSAYLPDARGSHDVKVGLIAEREMFDRRVSSRALRAPYMVGKKGCPPVQQGNFEKPCVSTVRVLMAADSPVDNGALGVTAGMYAQDNYKPVPNLSLGLGLRFERESADTFGFSYFDPAPERLLFNRLRSIAGRTPGSSGLQVEADEIQRYGMLADPLYNGIGGLSTMLLPLRRSVERVALGRLTRPHTSVAFTSAELLGLLPEIFSGQEVDPRKALEYGFLPQQRQSFQLTNHNLAPRLSVSWDPPADGRTKVFASWGRYFDKLFLGTIVGEEGPDFLTRYYLYDASGLNGSIPDANLGNVISKSPPSITQVDRSLQTPFSDELTLGFEREVAPEVALSVTFVDRRFRNQLQDVDVNHSLRPDPVTGGPADRLGLPQFAPGTSGQDNALPLPDGFPDLYVHNIFFNQVLRVGNYNEARYRAIAVELRRRLARRWEMQGSYTYSRAVGSAEDFQSRLGNDPSTVETEFGYLDYDQRHVVKLNAAILLPRDWQIGASASWASGLPYSIISRFFALDDANYLQFRTRYGFTTKVDGNWRFVPVRRNSLRNHAVRDLNFRVRKTLPVGRNAGALFLEVFNVLNTDDLRIFNYLPTEADSFNPNDPTPLTRLQLDGVRRFGRRIQMGFQFEF
ncbi:MAG TPA: carboxypeptidase regulatory-like domain-containing protein [Candidatus Polarisedimenticolia bacterium]|jgi:outer membrane receptor protein involved in Fe transport|nr:carboxypeptidase regulatory-like domain-containing protein [Candidatus Polarisedimenticolia bacterium]